MKLYLRVMWRLFTGQSDRRGWGCWFASVALTLAVCTGAIIRLLNLVQLPNEDTEYWWPRYNKTLERLQKGGEG